jgi:CTP:phosphocholine cytidylyltransferase-like protein
MGNNLLRTRFIAPTRPVIGKDKGISIIVLSSNPGYRMRSHGPQCLIKDKYGVSILDNQVAIFRTQFPLCEIILVAGFEIDRVAKYRPEGVRIVENQLYEQSGEIEDLRLALNNAVYESLFVIHGDIYFGPNLIKDIGKESTMILDDFGRMMTDDVGTTVVDKEVTIMNLAIPTPKWCKMTYFAPKEAKMLRQFVAIRDNAKLFLFEGLNSLLAKDVKFKSKMTTTNDIIVHVDSTAEMAKI